MKITQVNTYFVRPRWGFVEIVTDNGLTGWGEEAVEEVEAPGRGREGAKPAASCPLCLSSGALC